MDAVPRPRGRRAYDAVWPLAVVAVLILAAWGTLVLLGVDHRREPVSVEAAAAALALVAGGLLLARSRWTADVQALLIGSGFVALGGTRLLESILPLFEVTLGRPEVAVLRFGGRAIALVAIVVALTRREVDTRASRTPILGVVLAAAAGTAVLYAVLRPHALLLPEGEALRGGSTAQIVSLGLLAAAWLALAIPYLRAGLRAERPALAWFGLGFFFLGLAHFSGLPAAIERGLPAVGPAVLRAGGYACALVAVGAEMRRLYASQQQALGRTALTTEHLDARLRSDDAALEHRLHAARNALNVLQMATHTLDRHQDVLPSEERAKVVETARHGLARLGALLVPPLPGTGESFSLDEAVEAVAARARERGVNVRVEPSSELCVRASPEDVSRVVERLVDRMRDRAEGTEVRIRLDCREGRAVVAVEEAGEGGVALDRTGADDERHALELGRWAELVRDHGGDLWAEDRPGGRLAFVVTLPADSES